MKIFHKNKESAVEEAEDLAELDGKGAVAQTEGYTQGSKFAVNALVGGFYLLVLVALVVSVAAFFRPAPATAGGTNKTGDQQINLDAGNYAAGFVGAWLSATRDSSADLQAYTQVALTSNLPLTAAPYKDLAVATIAQPSKGLTKVVIAASIKQLSADGKTATWPRRYFQVAVNTSSDGYSVIGYPAPIAAPAIATGISLAYESTVLANDPAAVTVGAFLNAYAAGIGDLSRYISPGTSIVAITPAAYTAVKAVQILSTEEPAKAPSDGAELKVLTQVQLISGKSSTPATYALSLTARASRWEVSSIDPLPTISPLSPKQTASSPPSSLPNPSKGK